jgi:hypothetical protein
MRIVVSLSPSGVDLSATSLKFGHLYQCEIATASELAEEVESYLALCNEARPHEALGQRIPLAAHRADQYLFQA